MKDRPIRVLEATGTGAHRGAVHGAAFYSEIRRYAAERLRLSHRTAAGQADQPPPRMRWDSPRTCSAAHRPYDADLFEEMTALAAATNLSEEEILIVSGFTDFVDVVRAAGAHRGSRGGRLHRGDRARPTGRRIGLSRPNLGHA